MSPEKFFRALADETRLRCVVLIQQQGELCVCELTYVLNLAQPKISRHLAILKAANILQDRREGLWVYYQLHTNLPAWVRQVLQATVSGIQEIKPFYTDKQNLSLMPNREQIRCTVE
jgi:ArsR family transcriptional regulator